MHTYAFSEVALPFVRIHTNFCLAWRVPPASLFLFPRHHRSIGGTVGAVVTCPLEVIKTRLQSSQYSVASGHHWSVPHFVKYVAKGGLVCAGRQVVRCPFRFLRACIWLSTTGGSRRNGRACGKSVVMGLMCAGRNVVPCRLRFFRACIWLSTSGRSRRDCRACKIVYRALMCIQSAVIDRVRNPSPSNQAHLPDRRVTGALEGNSADRAGRRSH